jgi:hypothetical protein
VDGRRPRVVEWGRARRQRAGAVCLQEEAVPAFRGGPAAALAGSMRRARTGAAPPPLKHGSRYVVLFVPVSGVARARYTGIVSLILMDFFRSFGVYKAGWCVLMPKVDPVS